MNSGGPPIGGELNIKSVGIEGGSIHISEVDTGVGGSLTLTGAGGPAAEPAGLVAAASTARMSAARRG